MTSAQNTTHSTALSPALIRFVTDGLIATLDSYRAGRLPLHRFTWELHSRIDTLAELHPATRTLTRLRWLHRAIENLHTGLATTGRAELTADEENTLTVTLVSLRTALATLGPDAPLDPAGASRPAAPALTVPLPPMRRLTRHPVAGGHADTAVATGTGRPGDAERPVMTIH